MLIGFEASALRGRKSGVGYYTENMLAAIMRLEPEHSYVLFSNREMGDGWKPLGSETVHTRPGFPVRAVWMQALLPGTLRRVKPDLCHFTNYLAPLYTPCPYVVTMYDMSVFLTPRMHNVKKRILDRTLIPAVARNAGAILTISQSARKDILRCLRVPAEKVHVVMGAASPRFRPETDPARLSEVLARYGLVAGDGYQVPGAGGMEPTGTRHPTAAPYILYVGTIEPRKNLPRLVRAFARLKSEGLPHKLVIVGQDGWGVESLRAGIKRLGLESEVIFTGYVAADDLPPLYSGAVAMAFPSVYEGFGLPVIEAMACGAPVVTSQSSALAEVAGDAALLINPLSVDSIAKALSRVLTEPGLGESLSHRGLARSAQFTWDATARATLDVYEAVVSPRRLTAPQRHRGLLGSAED
jgi:glycosyltransferase involved in cell wall biosynthesis